MMTPEQFQTLKAEREVTVITHLDNEQIVVVRARPMEGGEGIRYFYELGGAGWSDYHTEDSVNKVPALYGHSLAFLAPHGPKGTIIKFHGVTMEVEDAYLWRAAGSSLYQWVTKFKLVS